MALPQKQNAYDLAKAERQMADMLGREPAQEGPVVQPEVRQPYVQRDPPRRYRRWPWFLIQVPIIVGMIWIFKDSISSGEIGFGFVLGLAFLFAFIATVTIVGCSEIIGKIIRRLKGQPVEMPKLDRPIVDWTPAFLQWIVGYLTVVISAFSGIGAAVLFGKSEATLYVCAGAMVFTFAVITWLRSLAANGKLSDPN